MNSSSYREQVDRTMQKIDNIEKHINRLYLYLWIANRPDNTPELREEFDKVVNSFLKHSELSLADIYNIEYGEGGEEVIKSMEEGVKMGKEDVETSRDRLNEIEDLVDAGEVLPLGKIRQYIGVFTGKMVKPEDDFKGDLTHFQKGDQVLVMNLEDYAKFQRGVDLFREDSKKTRREYEEYRKEQGWE